MNCRRSRLYPGAAAIAAALALSATSSLAQSAYADPAEPMPAERPATGISEPPVAPFAVVHPRYVPSQPAPDESFTPDEARDPQPANRAPTRVRKAAARAPAQPVSAADSSPVIESPPPVESPPQIELPSPAEPIAAIPPRADPVVADHARPAAAPAGVTLTHDDVVRLIVLAAAGALLVAAIGFALGRRSGRTAQSSGAIAKSPAWQFVMPAVLAGKEDAPAAPPDDVAPPRPGKRLKRGRSMEPQTSSVVSGL